MYPGRMIDSHDISQLTPPARVSIAELRDRIHNPIEYRRAIYRSGVRSAELPMAFGRSIESSADYYRYIYNIKIDNVMLTKVLKNKK